MAAKEAGTSASSEHLCSRCSFSHEKQQSRGAAGKFKTVKGAQVLGGQAFKKEMSAAVKTEGDGNDDDEDLGCLLITLNAPKHCKFLLR